MIKKCQITNKKFNNGCSVSHSHIKTKKKQLVNFQSKKIWLTKEKKWHRVYISTKAIKSIYKV